MATKPSAFAVHLFTGTGAVFALLAMLGAADRNWLSMFLWLGVGLIVDGIDGPLARKVDIKKNAANWDGSLLDLVIDYLTYVFIPAFALYYSELLPGAMGMFAVFMMTLTSVVYFADTRMKAKDNSFVGFPAVWHMPLLVLFVFQPAHWVTLVVVVALSLGQFTSLKFIHPVRTVRWRRFNLPVMFFWFLLAAWSVAVDMQPPGAVEAALLVSSLWLLVAGIVMQIIPERNEGSSAA